MRDHFDDADLSAGTENLLVKFVRRHIKLDVRAI
jgi:hypothetical protein